MLIKLSYIGLIIGLICSFVSTIIDIIIETKEQPDFQSKLSLSLQILLGGIIDLILLTVVALFVINNFL